jgi:hypothetical protein
MSRSISYARVSCALAFDYLGAAGFPNYVDALASCPSFVAASAEGGGERKLLPRQSLAEVNQAECENRFSVGSKRVAKVLFLSCGFLC